MGSQPPEIHIFVNFALCEVCTVSLQYRTTNVAQRYVRQVLQPTKKKNSPLANRHRFQQQK
jgi:hypothetical protein